MSPGRYDFPSQTRGDTFKAKTFVFSQGGNPLPIVAARMQVRTRERGELVHEWDTAGNTISIVSGTVTLAAVDPGLTQGKPVGDHLYDLEITLADNTVLTVIGGIYPILRDTTR